ncbi:hypothetical protein M0802_005730 [Mischocyttarus mexicanus]|nr:hypothetical protein M0802_005730 [Mischocyttarus mexicanus]
MIRHTKSVLGLKTGERYGAGYDLAARRKNATRESTATLKAWLNEHKKNPYPTKGEKIMLAIITKMTLTQVSTWFANARRRLKKENKMTWEPKNKTDDDDDAVLTDSEDNKEKDELANDNRGDRVGDDARRGLDDNASMSPSAAATAPYSTAAARYGGFLSTSSGGQLHYNPNSSSGTTSSASSSAAAGFPEVGTDTPPQTPPNMKVATPNGVIQPPPAGYCPTGNTNQTSNGNPNHYATTHPGAGGYLSANSGSAGGGGGGGVSSFASRLQSSPHKDFSPAGQNSILHQHQTTASLPPTEATTAFKPFYKGSQSMGSGFVSPV